jgi:RNA polymerase sigma factor (sigma-70 family)
VVFRVGAIGNLSDGQLLDRYLEGASDSAEGAFAQLVERHGSMVLATCRSVLRDWHDAEDAFQATFMILARRADSLRVMDSLGPWLHQVAYRTASCALAAAIRRRRHEQKAASLTGFLVREEKRDDAGVVLHQEIERLPERYRAVIVLCCLEGLTINQAARRLEWPPGTVQSRLARGRVRLRAGLVRRGLAPSVSLTAAALMPGPAEAAVPVALAVTCVRIAVQASAGRIAGAVPESVFQLMKGGMHSMFMTRVRIAATCLVTFAALMAGVGGLAQIAQGLGGTSGRDARPPTLKFEFRIWTEGDKNPKTVVGELTGGTSYNIETADAVIQIRPRVRAAGEEQPKAADRPKAGEGRQSQQERDDAESDLSEANRLLQMLNEKGRAMPPGANAGSAEKANPLLQLLNRNSGKMLVDPSPSNTVTFEQLKQARGKTVRRANPRGSPPANLFQKESDETSDLRRRLDRVDQKIEELKEALPKPQTTNPASP